MDRAADSGPCDPSSIPLGERKVNQRKEAPVGPFLRRKKITSKMLVCIDVFLQLLFESKMLVCIDVFLQLLFAALRDDEISLP